MMRTVVVVGALLLGVGAVMAQQDVAVKQAQSDEGAGQEHDGVLAEMVKGEKPYDQAAVDAALAQLEDSRQEASDAVSGQHQGSKTWRRRLRRVVRRSGKTRPTSTEHIASFGKVVDRSQGPDQGCRHAEGGISP